MSSQQKPEYAHIERAARNLLQLITGTETIQQSSQGPHQSQVQGLTQSQSVNQGSSQERQASVQQEMARAFPGIFKRERVGGKRRFPTPLKTVKPATKITNLQFYLLPRPMNKTPEGFQELKLLMAGLGKRQITMPENSNHTEISELLASEYPKLEKLSGGWLLYKASGGSGQRKLTVIPPESEGYNAKHLKSVSNNGKHIIFIVPLQEEIDIMPLPHDSPEFSKMPKSQCNTCGETLPLQVLALHVQACTRSSEDSDQEQVKDMDPDVCFVSSIQNELSPDASKKNCPICQVEYPADCIEMHASSCGESPSNLTLYMTDKARSRLLDTEAGEGSSGTTLHTTHVQNKPDNFPTVCPDAKKAEDWKTIPDIARTARMDRETVLDIHASEKPLHLHVDLRDSVSDQEMALIRFYKAGNIEWARPLQCRLEGDPAIGEGVNRFLISMVMQKLKLGFCLNFGHACVTRLFDGESDHLVPSTSAFLVESDLFLMAGRMIGHCFLHGGPALSGLSPAVIHILSGGKAETAVIEICDCPDLDLREKIKLLEGNSELSASEKESVNALCLSWDLPVVTKGNRRWLFDKLLHHAVIGRSMKQIKQIRKGLKETELWSLMTQRPDVLPTLHVCKVSGYQRNKLFFKKLVLKLSNACFIS
ncbi:uncharacterized protein LOC111188278 isoform X2 [Astyanax mexicanus]|uniref:uncharacterized protein LOC111188278 isoform X2 n=1 Tax=Astyanax mexicanus TaxID=7994 RepID=UPI0020CAADD6|nr:uncharacterized protein LOC111188278 isoform X2 [Astyanax mexicanus]